MGAGAAPPERVGPGTGAGTGTRCGHRGAAVPGVAAAAARLAFPAGVPRSPLRSAAAAQGAVRGPMQRTGEPLRFTGESARPVCLPTGPVAPCACSVYIPSGSPSALSGSPCGRCLSARSPRSLRGPRASLQESATVSPSPFPVPFGSPPCVPSAPRVPHVEVFPSSMSPRVPYCVPPGPYFPPACPVPLTHAGPHTPAGCTPHHSIGCSAPVSPPSPPPLRSWAWWPKAPSVLS